MKRKVETTMTVNELVEKIAENELVKDVFLKEQPSDLNSLTDFAKKHGIYSGALEISADLLKDIAGGMPLEGAGGACEFVSKTAGKGLFKNILNMIESSVIIPGDVPGHSDN